MNEPTKLLYMEDSYRRECKAAVKSVKEKNGTAEVILSETVFYPQGGGQPCDQGIIKGKSGEVKVTNVIYNNGNPIHQGKLRGELKEGDKADCVIDWNRRYKNMRVHSAGHLVHEAIHEAAPHLKPVRGQHGIGGEQFIEYEGEATLDKISLNMRLAQLINEKRAIKTYFVTLDELKKKAQFVPENLPKNKPLRVMEIDGFQPVPDGGTQVKSIGELDGTTITNIEMTDAIIKVHYEVVSETPVAGISKTSKHVPKKLTRDDPLRSILKWIDIKNNALAMITGADTREELEELRVKYLGRKGEINRMLAEIPKMAADEKTRAGEAINDLKRVIEEAIGRKSGEILETADSGWVDLTAPGIRPPEGHLHIVTQAIMEITRIFEKIGFTRVHHPEVDWDWYAFESLNMPPNHPARDEWETFFISSEIRNQKSEIRNKRKFQSIVLTPHTSNGQVREMEKGKLPIRMINIAKCYRRQEDVSHTAMFHQFEGLYVDKNVSIGHLKGVMDFFFKHYYGSDRVSRIRPFHFQFTEPSFEVDVNCGVCHGRGCRLCKDGWLELGGAGMVHPNVLKAGGVDPAVYNGFAFGWGIERVVIMKTPGLNDNRQLYSSDVRFLEQF